LPAGQAGLGWYLSDVSVSFGFAAALALNLYRSTQRFGGFVIGKA
jgi:hypothetical protein